jgi:glucose/arabinose dehydrogenase
MENLQASRAGSPEEVADFPNTIFLSHSLKKSLSSGAVPVPSTLPHVFRALLGLLALAFLAGSAPAVPADAPAAAATAVAQGRPIDASPLPIEAVPAFPDLVWTGWSPDVDGTPNPLRPILFTHAGDRSGRLFVPQQQGAIHVFRPDSAATKVFLDLTEKVHYADKQNEEGLLGLAFHPRFAENGEFFVHYSTKTTPLTMVLERYRVSKDDPDAADATSAEEILRVEHPAWNHKGGTICFGPDGYLYVAYGDGGKQNDPFGNGQNLQTLLGKVLRIDVDSKGEKTAYGIPDDNPFVAVMAENGGKPPRPSGVRREIWAYGLRNPWRMSFDRRTGRLWIADVGQDLWEEINLGVKGANYGWSLREANQPYAPTNTSTGPGFVDPVWQYAHDIGKSITGGNVYRGKKLPELDGCYLYADYVSGRLWALGIDETTGRAVSNRPIPHDREGLPVLSFGEDEDGEVYFSILSPDGRGIYTFRRREESAASPQTSANREIAAANSPTGSAPSTTSSPSQPR